MEAKKGREEKYKITYKKQLKNIRRHFMKLSVCNSINNFKSIYIKKFPEGNQVNQVIISCKGR